MSARFSEKCKSNPLLLETNERLILEANLDEPPCHTCEEDIYLGFFFDGTNNNKYRDTGGSSHSNVARLYEVYAGEPTVRQLGIVRGAPQPDENPAWPREPASDRKNYRKTYIPGVGTPFRELGDTGINGVVAENGQQRDVSDRKWGLAASKHGEARICWALLQVINHLHSILGTPDPKRWENDARLVRDIADSNNSQEARRQVLRQRAAELLQAINRKQPLNRRTPKIRRIRVSIFGFSRGAAKARVFLNWLLEAYGGGIAGMPLKVDFVGVFDTVASVGVANWGPALGMDGHYSWATIRNMAIPDGIRCVHLVAAHEVRGSFPLDSIGGGSLRKEVVYPGVHSDVGGGYPPKDQGRAVGGDHEKLSQLTLAQMYREALIAGVPLLLPDEFNTAARRNNFKVAPSTIAAVNAYIDATPLDARQFPPTTPPSKVDRNTLYPVERQPRASLAQLMHHHQGVYLRWRYAMLGRIHQLPNLTGTATVSRDQDVEDFRMTDAQLRKEVEFLNSKKTWADYASLVSAGGMLRQGGEAALTNQKRTEWAQGIKQQWEAGATQRAPAAADHLFTHLMHDSRSWFKPFSVDDADWFPPGDGQRRERDRRIAAHQRDLEQYRRQKAAASAPPVPGIKPVPAPLPGIPRPDWDAAIRREQAAIEGLRNGSTPVLIPKGQNLDKGLAVESGHEPWFMFGYLRRRAVFYGEGAIRNVTAEESQQDQIAEIEENGRQARARMRENETRRYEHMRQQQEQGMARVRQRYMDRQISDVEYADYMKVSQSRMQEAKVDYERTMEALSR
ncbi:hypothetical protein GCM10007860_33220 [Chitiniphilus shinanonensis]|uniref:T6SS Phospholipase effector Tle1-like catalytic domain-containing protein n=1 Tax=Chitiniphilus shinanonensis TaxID=553088 RepID=A0ABQ6C1Y3_9NEIS|nr:hypothetical protein GCM10007860_33220 [Chitiniphilus shinanonensis]